MARQTNRAAEEIYKKLKSEIFDFLLLPGDRFTETELALRYAASRTPVRSALYRLKHEGYLDVQFRSGWRVRPFDFRHFDELYDLRTVLEAAAVERLCQMDHIPLADLKAAWIVPASKRERDPTKAAALDEAFHCRLVEAVGNKEMARVYFGVSEKIRVIRKLGFLKEKRIDATYEEHAKLLKLILNHRASEAGILVRSHIAENRMEVRKITIHMLYEAREVAALTLNKRRSRHTAKQELLQP